MSRSLTNGEPPARSHVGYPDAVGFGVGLRQTCPRPERGGTRVSGRSYGDWRARRDSNPRPSVPKTDALSAELRARHGGARGGLQGDCSTRHSGARRALPDGDGNRSMLGRRRHGDPDGGDSHSRQPSHSRTGIAERHTRGRCAGRRRGDAPEASTDGGRGHRRPRSRGCRRPPRDGDGCRGICSSSRSTWQRHTTTIPCP